MSLKCPACGGILPGEFRKCKHCHTDLSWVDGIPCEPGNEQAAANRAAKIKEAKNLHRKAKQRELSAKAERKRILVSQKANDSAQCKKCGCNIRKYTSVKHKGLCVPCARGKSKPTMPKVPKVVLLDTWHAGLFIFLVMVVLIVADCGSK